MRAQTRPDAGGTLPVRDTRSSCGPPSRPVRPEAAGCRRFGTLGPRATPLRPTCVPRRQGTASRRERSTSPGPRSPTRGRARARPTGGSCSAGASAASGGVTARGAPPSPGRRASPRSRPAGTPSHRRRRGGPRCSAGRRGPPRTHAGRSRPARAPRRAVPCGARRRGGGRRRDRAPSSTAQERDQLVQPFGGERLPVVGRYGSGGAEVGRRVARQPLDDLQLPGRDPAADAAGVPGPGGRERIHGRVGVPAAAAPTGPVEGGREGATPPDLEVHGNGRGHGRFYPMGAG